MKIRRPITIDLPDDLLLAIGRASRVGGVSPTDFVVDTLAAALGAAGVAALTRRDTALVSALFDGAIGWLDLQTRLRGAGYVLRPGGTGCLALHSWPIERFLAPVEVLGHSLASLSARFRSPFPGLMPGTRLALLPENFPAAGPGRAA